MDTKILTDGNDINMIKKWISDKHVELKLLYRGSRDTFESSVFHSKCDEAKCTLSIIQEKDK